MLAAVHDRWFQSLLAAVGDPAIARLIMLVGYGMYYNATLAGGDPSDLPAESPENVDQMLAGWSTELIEASWGPVGWTARTGAGRCPGLVKPRRGPPV